MTESPRIEGLLRRIRREIRRRRAEYYGLRGAFWGAVAGVAVMLAKQGIGARAPWIAGGLVVLGLLVGLAYGAARGIRRGDVARVADRAFGLDDRVATTLEWADRPDRTRLVDALVVDTVARVGNLQLKRVVKRVVPREGQLLALPVLACLVLAITPPIPLPSGRLPDFLSSTEEERRARQLVDARGDHAPARQRPAQAAGVRGTRLRAAGRRQRRHHHRRSVGHLQGHLAREPAPRFQQLHEEG